MIRIEDLHKRFGEVVAVDGISFEAPDGLSASPFRDPSIAVNKSCG